MTTDYMKCPKCGAVMQREGYLQYGWYLDGVRVEGCPAEAGCVMVKREDLKNILAALEGAEPFPGARSEYQRLRAALAGK